MNIVVIYDDKFLYTTGFYCIRALEQLGHNVQYVNFMKSNQQQFKNVDFFFNVDDDSNYFLPEEWKPSVFWVSDTHRQHIKWRFEKSRKADILFTSQKNAFEQFKKEGKEKTFWLPHACDPELHYAGENDKKYDIGFIGNMSSKSHNYRAKLLNILQQKFKNTYFTNGHFLNDMAKIYSQCKIVFNCSLNNDINMRLFEGMCSGTLVVTDLIPNLFEVISNDIVVTYENADELIEKIEYFLEHKNERIEIEKQARIEVIENHSYKKRMENLTKIIKNNL